MCPRGELNQLHISWPSKLCCHSAEVHAIGTSGSAEAYSLTAHNGRQLASRSSATHRDRLGTLERVTALIGRGLVALAGWSQAGIGAGCVACGSAWADQSGFVGGDDELGPVACAPSLVSSRPAWS